jgi:hypothetical protein
MGTCLRACIAVVKESFCIDSLPVPRGASGWAKGSRRSFLWLDTYQTTKDLKRRGIVEIEFT